MKTVAYYTSPHFMDAMLETIQSIKHDVHLHVFIEINPFSRRATLIDLDSINSFNLIEPPEKVLGQKTWQKLMPYFEGVASIQFVIFPNTKSFSLKTLRLGKKLKQYIIPLNIDVFHFDTISNRAIGLIPYLRKKNVIITLHDAVPHTGENNWKESVANFLFFRLASSFLFYSKYSINQFSRHFKKTKKPLGHLYLHPYTVNKLFDEDIGIPEKNYLLFFGRLSYYKGVDILLTSLLRIFESFPDLKCIIIGKKFQGYTIDDSLLDPIRDKVVFISSHMPSSKLVQYIKNSQLVMCPYRESTQSGVLMTAKALGKLVVATNTGSFAEYIHNNIDGVLCRVEALDIANKTIDVLRNDNYKGLEKNISTDFNKEYGAHNLHVLLNAYTMNH